MEWLILGLLVGGLSLLGGCSNNENQEDNDSDENNPTGEDINKAINASGAKEQETPVEGALVLCTSAEPPMETVEVINEESNAVELADLKKLSRTDIKLKKEFKKCQIAPNNKCPKMKDIEGKEWKFYSKSNSQGADKEELNVDESYMICLTGYGMIYFEASGQAMKDFANGEGKMSLCIQAMEDYLQTGILDDDVIIWIAQNGNATLGNFNTGQFLNHKNDTTFDNEILAWTNFWNDKIMNNSNIYPHSTMIRADIVKAIIAQESSMGDPDKFNRKNAVENIMGCLFAGDPSIWIASGIDPTANGKYHLDSDGKKAIEVILHTRYPNPKNGALKEPNAALIAKYDPSETKKYGFDDGLDILVKLGIIKQSGGGASGNENVVDYNYMTPRVSIAIGTGILAGKINVDKDGDEKEGVKSYGTGNGYENDINKHLGDMGVNKIK